ncbi:MAG: Arc family DNA-binding protein [Candidatus Angelobacter sp.]
MIKPPVQQPKQQNHVKTALRIPKELHESLVQAANANGHSLNDEMLARLDTTLLNEITKQNEELKLMLRQVLSLLRN